MSLWPTGHHGLAVADWMATGEGGAAAGGMRPAGGAGGESGGEGGAGVKEQSSAGTGEAWGQMSDVTCSVLYFVLPNFLLIRKILR